MLGNCRAMRGLTLLTIIAVALLGNKAAAAPAQGLGTQVVAPGSASATEATPGPLSSGDTFSFTILLDRAPNGYDSGKMRCEFKREPAPTELPQFSFASLAVVEVPLEDGRAEYHPSLYIGEGTAPGNWKLAGITFGISFMKPLPFEGAVAFEVVPKSPLVAHIQAPPQIYAGQRLTFKITLDPQKALTDPTCRLILYPTLRRIDPGEGPDQLSFDAPPAEVYPGQLLSWEFSRNLEADLPSGRWEIQARVGWRQFRLDTYTHTYIDTGESCSGPWAEGFTFPFVLAPAPGLIAPTSAAVTVNPPQVKLLLASASRLRGKAQEIQRRLASSDPDASEALLRAGVQDALVDLSQTEAAFKERASGPPVPQAVDVFFDDLKRSYEDALEAIDKSPAAGSRANSRFELASVHPESPAPLSEASNAVIASLLHTARAYEVVASSNELTFTLTVYSQPQGATIAYKLRGEDYHPLDHETDWKIENLPRAVYTIRLQKSGYADKEVTYDAMDETSDSINVPLAKKRGK
jgi:hypothetical protein